MYLVQCGAVITRSIFSQILFCGSSFCVIFCFSGCNYSWNISWWRHQMGTFSALLTICAGNSPVNGEFPAQRPVARSFDIFFDLRLNKQLSKQSWGWWSETPMSSFWRQCNATIMNSVITALDCIWHNLRIVFVFALVNYAIIGSANWCWSYDNDEKLSTAFLGTVAVKFKPKYSICLTMKSIWNSHLHNRASSRFQGVNAT